MLTIAYAVYQKIFAACFAYVEQTGHCVVETLEEDSCTVLESSSPGFVKKYAFLYAENSLMVCSSLMCDFDCEVLLKDIDAEAPKTDCKVVGDIQIPFSVVKGKKEFSSQLKLHGDECSEAVYASIPKYSVYDAFNSNFELVTGDFSFTVIIACAVVLLLLTVFFAISKKK